MRFFPPNDEPLPIALTSGHTVLVEAGGTELDPRFHKEAISLGCRPEGIAEAEEPLLAVFDRTAVIRQAIEAMLDGAKEEDFTQDGKPNLKAVKERAGFNVSREECDAVWTEIAREAA